MLCPAGGNGATYGRDRRQGKGSVCQQGVFRRRQRDRHHSGDRPEEDQADSQRRDRHGEDTASGDRALAERSPILSVQHRRGLQGSLPFRKDQYGGSSRRSEVEGASAQGEADRKHRGEDRKAECQACEKGGNARKGAQGFVQRDIHGRNR